MVRLTISYNNEHLKSYELEAPTITVGRLPENTISIANMGISRRHLRMEIDAARNYVLSDLNSLNGTYVNNSKVKSCQLANGDMITIGKYGLLFEIIDVSPSTAPAAPRVEVPRQEEKEQVRRETSVVKTFAPPPGEERVLVADADGGSASGTSSHAVDDGAGQQDDGHPSASASATSIARREAALEGVSILIETTKHVVYKLDKQHMTLGSSESDDIYVSGFMIGDEHVVVEKKDDGMWIRVNKMMGKVKVNGQKTKLHRLEHKDRIEIGNSTFRFMENE